jgi:hypothetical protein
MLSNTLYELLEAVSDERSFLDFVKALTQDRCASLELPITIDGHQGEWTNQTIEGFLETAKSWAEDSQFGTHPGPKPSNSWKLFALFLWAGRGYE